MNKIGIIKESRLDDKRTPLAPKNIKELLTRFPDLSITVQPSKHRCFLDQEYKDFGAIISAVSYTHLTLPTNSRV